MELDSIQSNHMMARSNGNEPCHILPPKEPFKHNSIARLNNNGKQTNKRK